IVKGDRLGADEALLEIGVDHARRARRPRAFFDGPGARFLRTHGEIGHKAEKAVAGTDEAVETGFAKAERVEIVLTLFLRQNRDLAFDLRGDDDRNRAFLLRALFDHARILIARR